MPKRIDKFIGDINSAPKGGFGEASVPKALRGKTREKVREVMKADDQEEIERALENERVGLVVEIEKLEATKNITGQKAFTDIAEPIIAEKNRRIEEIEKQLAAEPAEPTEDKKIEKLEEVKDVLKTEAEKENIRAQKFLDLIPYLDKYAQHKTCKDRDGNRGRRKGAWK